MLPSIGVSNFPLTYEKVFSICENLKKDGYKVHAIKADVSDRSQIRTSFESAINILDGKLDVLINSAGIQRRHPSEIFPEKDWDDVIAINLEVYVSKSVS